MKTKTILACLALGSTACLTSGKSLSLPQAQIDQNTDIAIESAPPVIAKSEGKKKSVRIDLLKKSPAFGDRVPSIGSLRLSTTTAPGEPAQVQDRTFVTPMP
ncbi:MAG: hypothetical protein VW622_06450 [Opitutae bacterium]